MSAFRSWKPLVVHDCCPFSPYSFLSLLPFIWTLKNIVFLKVIHLSLPSISTHIFLPTTGNVSFLHSSINLSTLKSKSCLSSNKRSALTQHQIFQLTCIHIHTDMHTHFPDVIKSPCSLLPEPGYNSIICSWSLFIYRFPIHDSGSLSGRHAGQHSFSWT